MRTFRLPIQLAHLIEQQQVQLEYHHLLYHQEKYFQKGRRLKLKGINLNSFSLYDL